MHIHILFYLGDDSEDSCIATVQWFWRKEELPISAKRKCKITTEIFYNTRRSIPPIADADTIIGKCEVSHS